MHPLRGRARGALDLTNGQRRRRCNGRRSCSTSLGSKGDERWLSPVPRRAVEAAHRPLCSRHDLLCSRAKMIAPAPPVAHLPHLRAHWGGRVEQKRYSVGKVARY